MKTEVRDGVLNCPDCNQPISLGYDPEQGPPQTVDVHHTDEGHIIDRPGEGQPRGRRRREATEEGPTEEGPTEEETPTEEAPPAE